MANLFYNTGQKTTVLSKLPLSEPLSQLFQIYQNSKYRLKQKKCFYFSSASIRHKMMLQTKKFVIATIYLVSNQLLAPS